MSEEFSLGALILVQADQPASPLPLELTTVSGDILGGAATVRIAQRFGNPFKHPIEVEYLFPLPHEAAISDYAITIGARRIQAQVREREAARQAYADAQAEGKRASLLEQQRPNLFTIRVANIQPGEKILCEVQYDEVLTFKDGQYEFVFPMGLTPRYHTPTLPHPAAVDAPLAAPDAPIGPVEVTLNLRGAFADPVSPTHPLVVARGEPITVTLAGKHIPNKDFVMRFAAAVDTVRPQAWATIDDGGSEIALLSVQPPRSTGQAVAAQREFVFVIDRSGSMGGDPMVQARNALKTCLRMLGADDRFWILVFDDQLEWFARVAMAITQETVDAADRWIDEVDARGGTEILGAISAALALPVDAERRRYVVFLTDGAVSAEDAALREVTAKRGSARIFTFGLGPSVNRYLIDKMAALGRGWAEFLGVDDDIEKAITRFQDRVSYPALEDITLEWHGANAWDTYPNHLPDLYVGAPLEIVTRLARQGEGAVTLMIRGQRGGAPVEFSADVPPGDLPLLRRLWARARIEALSMQLADLEAARQQIIELALKYGLASRHTSFVAIDSEVTTGGKDQLVQVALPLPEGLRYEGFGTAGGAAGAALLFAMSAPPPAPRPIVRPDREAGNHFFRKRSAPAARAQSSADFEPEYERAITLPPLDEREELKQIFTANNGQPEILVKLLARKQKINGSWADDAQLTADALAAFMQAGHTTVAGDYRVQLRKAAQWLAQAIKDGRAGAEAEAVLSALSAQTGETFL